MFENGTLWDFSSISSSIAVVYHHFVDFFRKRRRKNWRVGQARRAAVLNRTRRTLKSHQQKPRAGDSQRRGKHQIRGENQNSLRWRMGRISEQTGKRSIWSKCKIHAALNLLVRFAVVLWSLFWPSVALLPERLFACEAAKCPVRLINWFSEFLSLWQLI